MLSRSEWWNEKEKWNQIAAKIFAKWKSKAWASPGTEPSLSLKINPFNISPDCLTFQFPVEKKPGQEFAPELYCILNTRLSNNRPGQSHGEGEQKACAGRFECTLSNPWETAAQILSFCIERFASIIEIFFIVASVYNTLRSASS